MAISNEKRIELMDIARKIRISVLEMLAEAGSGHTAGSLDMADIFSFLYFYELKHDPKNPSWKDRDHLILSNGHICPVLYASMAHAGYFPVEDLKKLRKFGSPLQGHPHREWLSGIETSSGPIGSGLSQAVGMALAWRMDKDKNSILYQKKRFYCLTGDGELDAGQVWEAAMLAGKEKLSNLTVIVDRNNIQIDGFVNDIMPIEPLENKWKSFNFNVISIDGHDFDQIYNAILNAKSAVDKPTVIIARTLSSKGVREFEGKFEWHGKSPSKDSIHDIINNNFK